MTGFTGFLVTGLVDGGDGAATWAVSEGGTGSLCGGEAGVSGAGMGGSATTATAGSGSATSCGGKVAMADGTAGWIAGSGVRTL
jgi:hypothetical protein